MRDQQARERKIQGGTSQNKSNFLFEHEASGTAIPHHCTLDEAVEIKLSLDLCVLRRSRADLHKRQASRHKGWADKKASKVAIAAPNVDPDGGASAGGARGVSTASSSASVREGAGDGEVEDGLKTSGGVVDAVSSELMAEAADYGAPSLFGGSMQESGLLGKLFNLTPADDDAPAAGEVGWTAPGEATALSFGACSPAAHTAPVGVVEKERLEADQIDGNHCYRPRSKLAPTAAIADQLLVVMHPRINCPLGREMIEFETIIKAARSSKDDYPSERRCANFFKISLGSGKFRQFDLDDPTHASTGHKAVFVTTRHLVKALTEKEANKVNLEALKDPSKAIFIFSKGDGEGSLFDLSGSGTLCVGCQGLAWSPRAIGSWSRARCCRPGKTDKQGGPLPHLASCREPFLLGGFPRRSGNDVGVPSVPPPSSRLSRWHAELNRVADGWFYRLGRRVALNPKKVVALALLGALACCAGFTNFRVESGADQLWVPRESISRAQEETIEMFFDEDREWALVLFEHADEGGNVLTKASVDVLWELDAKILELETKAGEVYSDLCTKDQDGIACAQPYSGVTTFWGNDFETYQATVNTDADVLEAINVDTFADGGGIAPAAIFGNTIVYDDDGRITGARVMMQSYALEKTIGDEAQEEVALEWLGVLQDYLGEEAEGVGAEGINMVYFTSRSLDDALAESVAGEVFLFVATYVVMILCVMLCVGRCERGAVERRSWLGLGGVGIVVASGVAAYGVCSGFGIPFTSLSQLLPFILIGIGVDDMFVILASLDHTDVGLPVEERLALALERCGVSISYTSLTNFSAFLLGSITKLPAVEYFCVYAATSILFVFVLQVTVFTAFLAMDLNRQGAGKMDWCCCCTSKSYREEQAKRGVTLSAPSLSSTSSPTGPPGTSAHDSNGTADARANSIALARRYLRQTSAEEEEKEEAAAEVYLNPMTSASPSLRAASVTEGGLRSGTASECVGDGGGVGVGCGGGGGKGPGGAAEGEVLRLTYAGRWMRDRYTPLLLSKTGKVIAIAATAGLLTAGIYGVTKAKQGFDALDLAPDDHFARDFMETARGYNLEPDAYFVGIEVFTPAVDYTNTTVQAYIQIFDELMIEQEPFTGPIDSWLTSFGKWAASSPEYSANVGVVYGYRVYEDRPTFYTALGDFLEDDNNERFQSDIAFDDNGEIEMSFSSMFIVDLVDTDAEIRALRMARDVMDRSPLEPRPFASSGIFLYVEQFLVIYEELITNFLLALAAVALLSLVVLRTVRVVLLVCVTVFIIDIELLGFVYHWGLEVNAINVIELIMAVGLVVDYMVHIVHFFLHQDPTIAKDLRIGRALGEIGPSVVVGAITTFLGIMPMAFANNVIFRVFFRMFFVIITFGFFHGVVFIPVALSLLPESCSSFLSLNAAGDSRKFTEEPDDARGGDAGPYDWLVFTSRFQTSQSKDGVAWHYPHSTSYSTDTSKSRHVNVVDVEAGSGLGAGPLGSDAGGSVGSFCFPDESWPKARMSRRSLIPQAEISSSTRARRAEAGGGLETSAATAAGETGDLPGGEWSIQVETGSGLGAPVT
eukprot:g13085.t1